MSTAFSYQGRLVAGGRPANGSYDLQLALFNASAAGSQIGVAVTNSSVLVSNGLFTTTIDFGPGLFDGTTYWIEVSVRPAGLALDWRKLQPRQRIAGTPYALYSANTDHANTATSATTAAGAPWSGLTGIPAGFADGVDNDTPYTAGPGLSLVNREFSLVFAGPGIATTAARSDHTHSAASIVSGTLPEARIDSLIARDHEILPSILANDGESSGLDADRLDGLDSEAFWQLGGNAGALNTRSILGTLDDEPLELVVNGERVLRLEPNGHGPNILAGSANNGIAADVAGATISGGGTLDDGSGNALSNRVEVSYGTVSGGLGNTAGSLASTVAGGRNNKIESVADYAVVGGGRHNTNSALYGTIAGGTTNSIRANAHAATISGGRANVIRAGVTNGTIPGGLSASAANYGQLAYASGAFAAPGDAQSSLYVLRGTTSNSVPTSLSLDGVGQQMKIPVGGRWVFEALVIGAMTGSSSNTAAYQLRGSIRNVNGVTTMVPGAPAPVTLGADPSATWNATAIADDPRDALIVRVFGASLGTIRWVATVRTTELIFP